MYGESQDKVKDEAMSLSNNKVCLIILVALSGIMLFIIAAAAVSVVKFDYPFHINLASGITLSDLSHPFAFIKKNCYPVWHVLTRLTMGVFGSTGRTAAIFVTAGCVVSTWFFAVLYLGKRHAEVEFSFLLAASVILMIVTPIYLSFFNDRLIWGQWGPNMYHNPTHLMVRAVAVPCFLLYMTDLERIDRGFCGQFGLRRLLALSLVFLLATFSKPSFIQTFIPSISLIFIYEARKHGRPMLKPLALLGLTLLPAVAVCCLQFCTSFYGSQADAGGVEFSFLKAWSCYSPCVPVSCLLATLFPLVMAAWAVRARRFTIHDAMAWLMLFIGLIEGAVLSEKGPRAIHGNFLWGWALGLFFVWLTAMEKFVSLVRVNAGGFVHGGGWWGRAAVVTLSAHFLSGIWYLWRLIVFRNCM